MVRTVPGLGQQLLNDCFGLLVTTLPKMMMANAALGVDEIQSGPVLVVESTPDSVLAVDCDRKGNTDVLDRLAYVDQVLFEFEFGRVNADDRQSLVLVFVRPCTHVGKGPAPVDAGISPKFDDDDFPSQLTHAQRL